MAWVAIFVLPPKGRSLRALHVARRGADVALNYRSKAPRAAAVAERVRARGRRALLGQADITRKLLQRARPSLIEQRRDQADKLPTAEEFATAIVDAAGG